MSIRWANSYNVANKKPLRFPRYILNQLIDAGAAAAYGLRKLRLGVPYAVRVRRASDNAELDIGFAGINLDVMALSLFSAGTSAYVTTWYDQSGNGNDATQSTADNQPRIVNAGVVDVDFINNPTINSIDTDRRLSLGISIPDRNKGSIEMVVAPDPSQQNSIKYYMDDIGGGYIGIRQTASNQVGVFYYDTSGKTVEGGTIDFASNIHLIFAWNGTNIYLWVNGVLVDSNSAGAINSSVGVLKIPKVNSTNQATCKISRTILYSECLSESQVLKLYKSSLS